MALVDLAYTSADQKEMKKDTSPMGAMADAPKYPWGLSLHLDDMTLAKLGKSVTDFKVGADLPLSIVVRVTGLSMRETEGGDPCQCVDLTVTKVDMPKAPKDQAKSLYGSEG